MNMAIDQVLWHCSTDGIARLRVYRWADRPALSLGYFQSHAAVRGVVGWGRLPFVRRMTGGGAIVHDDDLTYSLALPAAVAPQRSDELYDRLHRAIAAQVRMVGIPAVVDGSISSSDGGCEQLCFLRSDPFAVRVGACKILGSAQRRRPAAVMVQGSLLLAAASAAPDIPGLHNIMGRSVDRGEITAAIVRAVQGLFELSLDAVDLSANVRSQATELGMTRYRTTLWNERR
jgi:lipoate-protein ligase A